MQPPFLLCLTNELNCDTGLLRGKALGSESAQRHASHRAVSKWRRSAGTLSFLPHFSHMSRPISPIYHRINVLGDANSHTAHTPHFSHMPQPISPMCHSPFISYIYIYIHMSPRFAFIYTQCHTLHDGVFCEGRPIDMSTDLFALKAEANEWLRPEDDPGERQLKK